MNKNKRSCPNACPGCGVKNNTKCGSCCGYNIFRLPLSILERQLLDCFASLPFLPVIWDPEERRISLLECDMRANNTEIALSLLQRRGFVDIDLQTPLKNYSYGSHPGCLFGRAALTALGQDALDDLEYGGSYTQ